MQVCPGRDTPVGAGDEVTLIGTPDELAAASVIDHPERIRRLTATRAGRLPAAAGPAGVLGVSAAPSPTAPTAGPARPQRVLRALRDVAVSLARAADRRIAIALGALLTVLVTATLVLRFTYQYAGPGHRISLIDAVYFTVETVTTVGYGDLLVPRRARLAGGLRDHADDDRRAVRRGLLRARHEHAGEPRIEESLGRQKITALRGHVLVIGLGTVGLRVARQLRDAGRDVVVIEKDERNRHLGPAARARRTP